MIIIAKLKHVLYIAKRLPQGIYRDSDWNLCWQSGKCQGKVRDFFFCQTRGNLEFSVTLGQGHQATEAGQNLNCPHDKVRTVHLIATKLGRYIPLVMHSNWFHFGGILSGTFLTFFFVKFQIFFSQSNILFAISYEWLVQCVVRWFTCISGIWGLIDIKQGSVGYNTYYTNLRQGILLRTGVT